MRTFVVSDLHGQGKVYDAMIKYLQGLNEEVDLYINGDLIDRGDDSIRMLLDVINRDDMYITLLAGNHEHFLYQYLTTPYFDRTWLFEHNGGDKTCRDFEELSRRDKCKIINYLDNLPLSVKLDGIGDYDNIYLGHAKTGDLLDKKLKHTLDYSNNSIITSNLWYRDDTYKDVGIKGSFNIIGHTPVQLFNDCSNNKMYRLKNNVLNIDGGCCDMDFKNGDRMISPLVEIDYDNNSLFIIGFNKNGEIIDLDSIDLSKENIKSLSKK